MRTWGHRILHKSGKFKGQEKAPARNNEILFCARRDPDYKDWTRYYDADLVGKIKAAKEAKNQAQEMAEERSAGGGEFPAYYYDRT